MPADQGRIHLTRQACCLFSIPLNPLDDDDNGTDHRIRSRARITLPRPPRSSSSFETWRGWWRVASLRGNIKIPDCNQARCLELEASQGKRREDAATRRYLSPDRYSRIHIIRMAVTAALLLADRPLNHRRDGNTRARGMGRREIPLADYAVLPPIINMYPNLYEFIIPATTWSFVLVICDSNERRQGGRN